MAAAFDSLAPQPGPESGTLRVLMVTPLFGTGGGVGTCSQELWQTLCQHPGVAVDLLCWWPGLSAPRFIDSQGTRVALRSLDELLGSSRQYDVLHFQSAAYSDRIGGGLSRIRRRFQAPVVYTVHALAAYHGEILGNLDAMQQTIDDQLEMMDQADCVVLLTRELVEVAGRHYHKHASKFTVVPNGTRTPAGRDSARIRLRNQLGLDDTARVILYMGRISPEKGIYELVDAFPQVAAAHPNVRLIIAGNQDGDPNVAALRETLAKAGLCEGQHYHLAGWVAGEDKDALYALADLVVLPSYYEHLPLTALEAMIRHKPVIITDMESLRETFRMRDPEQSWVVPIARPKSAAAVAAALRSALAEPEQVAARARRAYQGVLARHTWGAVSRALIHVYRRLLSESVERHRDTPARRAWAWIRSLGARLRARVSVTSAMTRMSSRCRARSVR